MSCVLCGNTPENLKKIEHWDDIIELFGARNVTCIDENQALICMECQQMLEKLAQLKRRLRYLILLPPEKRKPVDLTHIWNVLKDFNLDEGENERRCIPTPNPSLLVTVSDCEDFVEEESRKKGIPRRAYSGVNTPRSTRSSSVASSHGSGKLPTRRSARLLSRSRAQSVTSMTSLGNDSSFYDYSRPNTPYSGISSTSSFNQRLSRKIEEMVYVPEREQKDPTKFYCPDENCDLYYLNMDTLDSHLVVMHKKKPLFFCTECESKYTQQEHLEIHSKNHDFFPFFCLLCTEPQRDRVQLQYHLDQHMTYSYSCPNCDKSFLTEELWKVHDKLEHIKKPRSSKRKKSKQKRNIFSIVYNKDTTSNPISGEPNPQGGSEEDPEIRHVPNETDDSEIEDPRQPFQVQVMVQNPFGLDVTEENLILENAGFYRGEGYEELVIENPEDWQQVDDTEDNTDHVNNNINSKTSDTHENNSGRENENPNYVNTETREEVTHNSDVNDSITQPLVNGINDMDIDYSIGEKCS